MSEVKTDDKSKDVKSKDDEKKFDTVKKEETSQTTTLTYNYITAFRGIFMVKNGGEIKKKSDYSDILRYHQHERIDIDTNFPGIVSIMMLYNNDKNELKKETDVLKLNNAQFIAPSTIKTSSYPFGIMGAPTTYVERTLFANGKGFFEKLYQINHTVSPPFQVPKNIVNRVFIKVKTNTLIKAIPLNDSTGNIFDLTNISNHSVKTIKYGLDKDSFLVYLQLLFNDGTVSQEVGDSANCNIKNINIDSINLIEGNLTPKGIIGLRFNGDDKLTIGNFNKDNNIVKRSIKTKPSSLLSLRGIMGRVTNIDGVHKITQLGLFYM